MTRFSKEFKDFLVKKLLSGTHSLRSVATEAEVGISTLHKWAQDAKKLTTTEMANISPGTEKRPCEWNAAKRFEAVIESVSLSDEELNRYCRQQGIYKTQLEQWKLDCMSDKESSLSAKKMLNELKVLRSENKQ